MSAATAIFLLSFVIPVCAFLGWAVWLTLGDPDRRIP